MELLKYYDMAIRYYNEIKESEPRKMNGESMTIPGQSLTVSELVSMMNNGYQPTYTPLMSNDDNEDSEIIEASYDLVDLYEQFDALKEKIAIQERKNFAANNVRESASRNDQKPADESVDARSNVGSDAQEL